MISGDNHSNRRTVLKASTGVLAGSVAVSGATAKHGDTTDQSTDECDFCSHQVGETDYHVYMASKMGVNTNVYKISKNTGSVEFITIEAGSDEELEIQSQSNADQLSGYHPIIERSDGIFQQIEGCDMPISDGHYYVGVSIETVDNPSEFLTNVLAGAICSTMEISTPIPGESVIFGGFCSGAAHAIQNLIFDSTITVGARDFDAVLFPKIVAGTSDKYGANWDELSQFKTVDGHIDIDI